MLHSLILLLLPIMMSSQSTPQSGNHEPVQRDLLMPGPDLARPAGVARGYTLVIGIANY